MKNGNQNLRSELAEINKIIPIKKSTQQGLQREISTLEKRQIEITSILNKPSDKITVTDHAILRYLERKFNIDIASIKNEMLSESVVSAIKCGAKSVKQNGMQFKITNKVITTCY